MRYDGGDCVSCLDKQSFKFIQTWQDQGWLLALCPEVAGGLSVPRPAAEIQGSFVKTQAGADVSVEFERGAKQALNLCLQHDIRFALLKQGSPSCGNSLVNDGSFSKIKIHGQGITAKLLSEHGVQVFNEHEISELAKLL